MGCGVSSVSAATAPTDTTPSAAVEPQQTNNNINNNNEMDTNIVDNDNSDDNEVDDNLDNREDNKRQKSIAFEIPNDIDVVKNAHSKPPIRESTRRTTTAEELERRLRSADVRREHAIEERKLKAKQSVEKMMKNSHSSGADANNAISNNDAENTNGERNDEVLTVYDGYNSSLQDIKEEN